VTPYEELGVRPNASAATIRKAFRRRARESHPDANPGDPDADARYKRIVDAHELLSDPARRKAYDETGDARAPRDTAVADVMEVLYPVVLDVIQQAGSRVGVTNVLVAVTNRVKTFVARVDSQMEAIRNGLDALRAAVGRVKPPPDGIDFVGEVVRNQIRLSEASMKQAAAERDKLHRVLDYLARCEHVPAPAGQNTTASYADSLLAFVEAVTATRKD
jgi:hypothetical protein